MKVLKMAGKWLVIISGIFVLFVVVSIALSLHAFKITRYEYKNKTITSPFTAVQLSDLHSHEFGKDNQRLIRKIADERPDVIFVTGDMLNDDEESTRSIESLIRELKEIAPVYYSLGNHELAYMKKDNQLVDKLKNAGATILDQDYVDTEIRGQKVRIGGVYGYVLANGNQDDTEQRFMKAFEDTEQLKILLSHIPEGLLLWKSMEYWDVDLVFSGHVHGGQVRIPFVGGLFDPEEGYFPTYTKGMFECGNGTIVLSAGLGSSQSIPRVNNIPEIVICRCVGLS